MRSCIRSLSFLAFLSGFLVFAPRTWGATFYSTTVLKDAPFLYWNFDEEEGSNASQVAPLVPLPLTSENDLKPVAGATRVNHAAIGSGLTRLGNAAEFHGTDFFQAEGLRSPQGELAGPYAVELWLQVQGDNSALRQDYLIDFGSNAPALIYDYNPDEFELYNPTGRTAGGPIVSDSEWHHLLFVYYGDIGGGEVDAFLDGNIFSQIQNSFIGAVNLKGRIIVGASLPDGSDGFVGRLDEVAVYDLSALPDANAVSAKAYQIASTHFAGAKSGGTSYAALVLNDQPLLYWNFDEADGNSVQKAPLTLPPFDNTHNELIPNGAGRVAHAAIASGLQMGNAANFDGATFFQSETLDTGRTSLPAPWAVEFWMQVQGENVDNRADYLINFGGAGADNSPAFIYDYKPNQLEIYHGPRTDGGPIVNDDEWHHVVWVDYGKAGATDKVDAYLDGTLLPNVGGTFSRDIKLGESVLVGAALPTGIGGFEGRMDEPAIYDLRSWGDEAAIKDKITKMVANHYAAAFGDPGNATLTITKEPADVTANIKGNATFDVEVAVTGAPASSVTYQWKKNGINIPGATERTYTIAPLQLGDAGTNKYSVRVSLLGIFKESREAVLNVAVPPPAPTTAYASAVLKSSPLLYWNFDEMIGDAIQQAPLVRVPITTENDLIPEGANRVSHADISSGLKLGNAADFDGTTDFELPALLGVKKNLNAPWAVEFWMQVQGDDSELRQDYLLNFGVTGGDNSPAFIYDYKPDSLELYTPSNRSAIGPTVTDQNWHHVVWVFYGDGTTGVADRLDAYFDGNLVSNLRASFSRALKLANGLRVGAALAAGVGGFEGRMDELAIYDLSAAPDTAGVTARATAIASHFAAASSAQGNYKQILLADHPILYWNFDEADGNALQLAPLDSSPLDNSKNNLQPQGGSRVDHQAIGSNLALGNAADFNGSSGYRAAELEAGKGALNGPWAVENWVQVLGPTIEGRNEYLANFGPAGGDNSPALIYDFKPQQLEIYGGGLGRTDAGPTIADNDWHHLFWVFYGDGNRGVVDRMDAYLDGNLVGSIRNDFAAPFNVSGQAFVGEALAGGINGFKGRVDELAIYDFSSLTTEEAITAKAQQIVTEHRQAASQVQVRLNVSRSGQTLTLSWSQPGFDLEENSNLANPNGWTKVPGGENSPVIITIGNQNRFYRLHKR